MVAGSKMFQRPLFNKSNTQKSSNIIKQDQKNVPKIFKNIQKSSNIIIKNHAHQKHPQKHEVAEDNGLREAALGPVPRTVLVSWSLRIGGYFVAKAFFLKLEV